MEYSTDKTKTQSAANSSSEKVVQNKSRKLQDNRPVSVLQRKVNNTGLPNNLKSGIENLSGHSMDDVKVHYNSDKPAQLNAHAYAQGTDIHIASGQEKHLPHEAWHVIQQKQGRVKPTLQMKGKVNVNDDKGLESEADVMGAKASATNKIVQKKDFNNNHSNLLSSTLSSSSNVKQLKKENIIANGITHLVKLNEEGSLYQENFTENEVAETRAGETLTIETANRLRSRRGPNQELNPLRDAKGESNQIWVNALTYNKQDLPPHSYIREGTYTIEPEGAVAEKPKELSHSSKASLLLPYAIPSDREVYMIDAAHRGDMYQVRAALAVHPAPLIIFNCRAENDLTHYLTNAPGAQVHKVPYNPAKPNPEDFRSGLVLRMFTVLSESDATHKIITNQKKQKDISEHMTVKLTPDVIAQIRKTVLGVFGGESGNIALMMYRDSGQTNLVYPELDSGEALVPLAQLMHKKGFEPVFCGAPGGSSIHGIRNIGFYWKALDGIRVGDNKDPLKFKRDIEAEFMRQAYQMAKFRIVVGFRSGVIDLFTLLGIPTISISLKNLVGEDRHGKFAGNRNWQRTNIQYDHPRNEVTDLMDSRGSSKQYMSPYWKMRGHQATDKKAATKTAPAPSTFDERDHDTIETGINIGISKLRPISVSHPEFTSSQPSSSSSSSVAESVNPLDTPIAKINHALGKLNLDGVVTSESIKSASGKSKSKPLVPKQAYVEPTIAELEREKWATIWAKGECHSFAQILIGRWAIEKAVPANFFNKEKWELPEEGGRSLFNMDYKIVHSAYDILTKNKVISFDNGVIKGVIKGTNWEEAYKYFN
ncbi:hypothetical protein D3C85_71620 [compost metagenome]